MRLLTVIFFAIALGCSSVPKPQRGGHASSGVTADGNLTNSISQGDNAGQATTQTTKEEITREFLATDAPPSRSVVRETTKRETATTLGAAQKDEGRALGVKMDALKPVMLAGLLMLAAAGALAYFQNYIAAAIAGALGVAMLVLFVTLPQHGMLIMSVGLGVGAIVLTLLFLTYYKGKLDANHNGIPDLLERNP